MVAKNRLVCVAFQSVMLLTCAGLSAANGENGMPAENDAERGLREFCEHYPEFDGELTVETLTADAFDKYYNGLKEITDGRIKHLKHLTRLKVLDLRGTNITDAGLEQLQLQSHPNLCSLSLDHTRITDAGLRFVGKMTSVTGLNLAGDQITGAGLECLLPLKLRGLTLGHNDRITDADLKYVAQMGDLRTFELFDDQITDAGVGRLAGLKQLQTLGLFSNQITDAGVTRLEPLVNLEALTLVSDQITDVAVARLNFRMLPIWRLEIGGPKVTDALLERLKGCRRLTELNLMHNTIQGIGLKDPQLMPLMRLSLSDATDEKLKYIGEQSNLFHLMLYRPKFTSVGLRYLKSAPGLKALSLCDFTDENVKLVAGLTNLEFLYLYRPKTPNAGLRHLANAMPNLHTLFVSEVNDEGLKFVAEMKPLVVLDLYRPRFTDEGLTDLKKLPNLGVITMYLAARSKAQVDKARRALPNCSVGCSDWEANFLSVTCLETD